MGGKTAVIVGSFVLGGMVLASPASARDSYVFADCDGHGKPGRSVDGLASPVSITSIVPVGSNAAQATIEACNLALAHPKLLPGQGVRRAHLLRARATARLRDGRPTEALADLDLAQAATGSSTEASYARSMIVSLDLLRALIHDQLGNANMALRLAKQSAAARPYSLEVQRVAAHLLLTNGATDVESQAIILGTTKLDPGFTELERNLLAQMGDFKAITALPSPLTGAVPAPIVEASAGMSASSFLMARSRISGALLHAYARAATGDGNGAQRDLAAISNFFAALGNANTEHSAEARAALLAPDGELITLYTTLVGARIALDQGRRGEAEAALAGVKLPVNPIGQDLQLALARVVGNAPTPALSSDLRRQLPTDVRNAVLFAMVKVASMAPELPDGGAIYKQSKPNVMGALVGAAFSLGTSLLADGVGKTDGFTTTPNSDGTINVSLIGGTNSSAAVREAVLLRAADVALAAGKGGVVVLDRNDYQRYWTTTQYGRTISSVPSGYQSVIKIELVASLADDPRALDAAEIASALKQFYYPKKP